MKIVTQPERDVLEYEVRYNRQQAQQSLLSAEAMESSQAKIKNIMKNVAEVIESTRPVVLPMTWSSYPQRLWDQKHNCVLPCVTMPTSRVTWTYRNWVTNDKGYWVAVVEDSAKIYVIAEPCWETYRRWGDVITSDFFKAMRAVRNAWKIKWIDNSRTSTKYEYMKLALEYVSKDPIATIVCPIRPVEEYGKTYEIKETRVDICFVLTMPDTPNGATMPNCHVVEEMAEITEVRKVKRISCE